MKTTVRLHHYNAPVEIHNMREPELAARESHIDAEGIHEVWGTDRTLREAYEDIFGEYLEEYNQKQKRKDRQLDMDGYMQSVLDDTRGRRKTKIKGGNRVVDESSKKGKKLSYELVVSAGNTEKAKDENGETVYDEDGHIVMPQKLPYELNRAVCRRYYETFEQRNPSMKIVRADWHADEFFTNKHKVKEQATEHVHIEYVPVGSGYSKGLKVQNSMNRALSEMGFKDEVDENGKWICAYEAWQDRESEYLEEVLQQEYAAYCRTHPDYAKEHGEELTILHPYADRNAESLTAKEYRKLQDTREAMSDTKADLRNLQDDLTKMQDELTRTREELQTAQDELSETRSRTRASEKIADNRKREADRMHEEAKKQLEQAQEIKVKYDRLLKHAGAEIKVIKESMDSYYDAARDDIKKASRGVDMDTSRKAYMTNALKLNSSGKTAEEGYQEYLVSQEKKRQAAQKGIDDSQRRMNMANRHVEKRYNDLHKTLQDVPRFDESQKKDEGYGYGW